MYAVRRTAYLGRESYLYEACVPHCHAVYVSGLSWRKAGLYQTSFRGTHQVLPGERQLRAVSVV